MSMYCCSLCSLEYIYLCFCKDRTIFNAPTQKGAAKVARRTPPRAGLKQRARAAPRKLPGWPPGGHL